MALWPALWSKQPYRMIDHRGKKPQTQNDKNRLLQCQRIPRLSD